MADNKKYSHKLEIHFNKDNVSDVAVVKTAPKSEGKPTNREEIVDHVNEDLSVCMVALAAIIRGAEEMGLAKSPEMMEKVVNKLGSLVFDADAEAMMSSNERDITDALNTSESED